MMTKYFGIVAIAFALCFSTVIGEKRDIDLEELVDRIVHGKPREAESPTNVVQLTSETFEAAVKGGEFSESKLYFVKFFAPWCGHCKNLSPTWELLADAYAKNPVVEVAKVDCTVEEEICNGQEVRGFPTLRAYFRGGKQNYEGNRTFKELKDWLHERQLDVWPDTHYEYVEV